MWSPDAEVTVSGEGRKDHRQLLTKQGSSITSASSVGEVRPAI